MDELEQFRNDMGLTRENYDIAVSNLTAALDLPGAEGLNIEKKLSWLGNAAKVADAETLRHAYQFHERPQDFYNSPAYFCMLAMVTALQKELGFAITRNG